MAAKKSRLGRGLDALIGGADQTVSIPKSITEKSTTKNKESAIPPVKNTMPVHELQRGRYQPRTHMDDKALESLQLRSEAKALFNLYSFDKRQVDSMKLSLENDAGVQHNLPV